MREQDGGSVAVASDRVRFQRYKTLEDQLAVRDARIEQLLEVIRLKDDCIARLAREVNLYGESTCERRESIGLCQGP